MQRYRSKECKCENPATVSNESKNVTCGKEEAHELNGVQKVKALNDDPER